MSDSRYMVGSGWWCGGAGDDERAELLGDPVIRTREFHRLWYASLIRCTSPERILIVDSHSPLKPPLADDPRLELRELASNAGHATAHRGHFCGWTRAVLVGLLDCLANDHDYFVYVEQDVLLWGPGLIEHAIERMRGPYCFGSGVGTPQPLQQSLFIVARRGIAPLLSWLLTCQYADRALHPEKKFALAVLPRLSWLLPYAFFNSWVGKRLLRRVRGFDPLPFGHGRQRPLDFAAKYGYFQHATSDELAQYRAVTGIGP